MSQSLEHACRRLANRFVGGGEKNVTMLQKLVWHDRKSVKGWQHCSVMEGISYKVEVKRHDLHSTCLCSPSSLYLALGVQ